MNAKRVLLESDANDNRKRERWFELRSSTQKDILFKIKRSGQLLLPASLVNIQFNQKEIEIYTNEEAIFFFNQSK